MKSPIRILKRRLARFVEKSVLPFPTETIVTFSFDDCPISAIETAVPMLEKEGWKSTIYVACGLCETENHLGRHMSLDDIVNVHKRGHEIADHTFSHLNTMDVGDTVFVEDIARNQKALHELGLPSSRHFAYPFGEVSPALKKVLRKKFKTLRGVISPANSSQDANLLNAMRLYSGETIDAAIDQIKTAPQSPQWLNLFTHDVRENPSEFGCTPAEFQRVVDAVKERGIKVMTVDQAYRTIQQSGENS